MSEHRHRTLSSQPMTSSINIHTIIETLCLTEQAALAKSHLSYPDLLIKSFLCGIFISLSAASDLIIVSDSPGLRASNPTLAILLGGLCFPIPFVMSSSSSSMWNCVRVTCSSWRTGRCGNTSAFEIWSATGC
ncbi:hypothetical protein NX059_010511 [Plenodomus lindquistii]|nr:hypothetical protein NX059_010511 [Plenodomus lindquistii]